MDDVVFWNDVCLAVVSMIIAGLVVLFISIVQGDMDGPPYDDGDLS